MRIHYSPTLWPMAARAAKMALTASFSRKIISTGDRMHCAIYVNFTDEPTQPGGDYAWGTDSLCNYMAGRATVHTVWTGTDTSSFVPIPLSREKPWEMSYCTGGETRVFDTFASGLNLLDLPVTAVAANSYVVEFVTSNPNQPHQLIITVKSGDDDGKTVYENIMY